MIIREHSQEDLKKIENFAFEILKHDSKLDNKIDINENVENWLRKEFRKHCGKNKYFVAEHENKIIGFIEGRIESRSYYKDKKIGFMWNIFVHPRYRRKGIGKELIKRLLEWFRENKIKYVETEIGIKNIPSINLHKSLGFEENNIRMRKIL